MRSARRRGPARWAGLLVLVVVGALAASATPATATTATPAATTACVVSGPLMGLAPYPGARFDTPPPFVHLTASDGKGAWAGVSFTMTTSGYVFTVVRRDPGGHVVVLGQFVYSSGGVSMQDTVKVVGIDPWGGVIASVQRTNYSIELNRFIAVRWDSAGTRHDLVRGATWLSAVPVGVADSGSVVGTARGANGINQVVIWRGTGSGVLTKLSAPGREALGFSANSDWYDRSTGGGTPSVHVHNDQGTRPLTDLGGTVVPWSEIQATSYASALGTTGNPGSPSTPDASARWSPVLFTSPSTAPVRPTSLLPFVYVSAAGRAADTVGSLPSSAGYSYGPRVLLTATGKQYALPSEFHVYSGGPAMSEAIDPQGRVVFTGSQRVPLQMTCPR